LRTTGGKRPQPVLEICIMYHNLMRLAKGFYKAAVRGELSPKIFIPPAPVSWYIEKVMPTKPDFSRTTGASVPGLAGNP
jgi:hypothetical protein